MSSSDKFPIKQNNGNTPHSSANGRLGPPPKPHPLKNHLLSTFSQCSLALTPKTFRVPKLFLFGPSKATQQKNSPPNLQDQAKPTKTKQHKKQSTGSARPKPTKINQPLCLPEPPFPSLFVPPTPPQLQQPRAPVVPGPPGVDPEGRDQKVRELARLGRRFSSELLEKVRPAQVLGESP